MPPRLPQEQKPLVAIVVEQPEGEQKPKSQESYAETLERAKRNLGLTPKSQESTEIAFESSEQ